MITHSTSPPSTRSYLDTEKEISQLQRKVRDHMQSNDYVEALEVAKECLRVVVEHFGTAHVVTASSLNNLGLILKNLGQYEEGPCVRPVDYSYIYSHVHICSHCAI